MRNRTTAAIFAFFLGAFGIHRFYLGQNGKGILYLIFCWTFIPAFLSMIDFILLITMNDDTFDFKYNKMYMEMQERRGSNHLGQGYARGQQVETRQRSFSNKDTFEIAGDLKYEDYDFDGAIEDYHKSLDVRPSNPEVHFKLACLYSNLEEVDNSMFHIDKAVEKGYYDLEKIRTHQHLAFVRSHNARFNEFAKNGFRLARAIVPTDKLILSNDLISQIERLAKLKDQGLINQDEFQTQKTKILNR